MKLSDLNTRNPARMKHADQSNIIHFANTTGRALILICPYR